MQACFNKLLTHLKFVHGLQISQSSQPRGDLVEDMLGASSGSQAGPPRQLQQGTELPFGPHLIPILLEFRQVQLNVLPAKAWLSSAKDSGRQKGAKRTSINSGGSIGGILITLNPFSFCGDTLSSL